MRLRGHGNILLLEGTLDTPENKRFWGAHGARALRLAKAAKGHAALAKLPSAAAAEMDAFMYQGSAKGIVQTALTGDGFEFKRLAEALIADHELHDGASSHCYLGGFYNVAPWPLKAQKKALVEMRAAAALEPRSRRNQYYVCVVELQLGNAAAAADACERARRALPRHRGGLLRVHGRADRGRVGKGEGVVVIRTFSHCTGGSRGPHPVALTAAHASEAPVT